MADQQPRNNPNPRRRGFSKFARPSAAPAHTTSNDPTTPQQDEQLRQQLGDSYNKNPQKMQGNMAADALGTNDSDSVRRRTLRLNDQAADEADTKQTLNDLQSHYDKAVAADGAKEPHKSTAAPVQSPYDNNNSGGFSPTGEVDRDKGDKGSLYDKLKNKEKSGGEDGADKESGDKNSKDKADTADNDNFYNNDEGTGKRGKGRGLFKGFLTGRKKSKKKKLIVGGLIGAIGLMIGMFLAFGNFFALFKLDHLLQNMDSKSFSRFNASFTGRSNSYLKAYMKLRMAEISNPNGTYSGDNLFFKANKVDTGSPIRDWYHTLRTGSFETNLRVKQGITFTSVAVKNASTGAVTLRPGVLKIKDTEALFDNMDAAVFNQINGGNLDAVNKLGKDMDTFFDVQIFDSSRQARKAVKTAVNDDVHFLRVIKRRHIRKDIENKTGIGSWKFFEPVSNRIASSKLALQQKILQKVVPNNSTGNFIKCILGAGKCVSSNDPNAPENQLGAAPNGDPLAPNESDPGATPAVDENGNPIVTTDANGNVIPGATNEFDQLATAGELTDAIDNVAAEAVDNEAGAIILSPSQKLIAEQINSFVGGNIYTKAWSWAKKLAKIHDNIINSKFSKVVKAARVKQLVAIYTVYSIARDQGRSGQLTSPEFGLLMQTLGDSDKSEGWQSLSNNMSGSVSSGVNQTQAKINYCKLSDVEKKQQKVQYFCDSPNDSNAARIEAAYRSSPIFPLLNGIATAVKAVNSSFIGSALNAISSLADSVLGKILDPIINAALNVTGAKTALEKVIGFAMTKIMSFLGAGPMYDGTQAGAANYLLAGSSATAETSTRDSGGVASTPITKDYTTKQAALYEKDKIQHMTAFDRYASLSNSSSLFSKALFNVSTMDVKSSVGSVFSTLASFPKMFLSVFSGHLTAAPAGQFDAASWAGVDTYDIPQQCQDLDPLDTDYVTKAVGVVFDSAAAGDARGVVNGIMPQLTIVIESDSAAFWKLVYDKIGNKPNAEEIASAIYNCALLDQRVRGGMGYISGYTADNGLNEGETLKPVGNTQTAPSGPPPTTSTEATTAAQCATITDYTKIICAGKQFLGVRYANYNAGGTDWDKVWGVHVTGSLGQNPPQWIAQRVIGGDNDFMECSGFVKTAIYAAYGVVVGAGCSAQYRFDPAFKTIDFSELRPGDLLIESAVCGNGGHIGIYLGTTSTGRYSSLESASTNNSLGKKETGFYERAPSNWKFAVRYIGQGATP